MRVVKALASLREARGLNFGLSLHVHPYFVYVSSGGCGESVQCTDSPEPPLLADAISTEISCTGPHIFTDYMYLFL